MTATILEFKRKVQPTRLLSFNDLYLLLPLAAFLGCLYLFVWGMTRGLS